MPNDDVVVRFINIETGFEWENAAISLIITGSAAIYTADTQADPSRCAVQSCISADPAAPLAAAGLPKELAPTARLLHENGILPAPAVPRTETVPDIVDRPD